MQTQKIIRGNTEDELWQQVQADLVNPDIAWEYKAVLMQGDREIILSIDVDPGGGFESGYALTSLIAPLTISDAYHLSVSHQGFLEEAGKLFGLQDVVLGYPGFDEKVLIKTNDAEKTKALFTDADVRETIGSLPSFSLKITHHQTPQSENKVAYLELQIDEEITDIATLQKLYHAVFTLATTLDKA